MSLFSKTLWHSWSQRVNKFSGTNESKDNCVLPVECVDGYITYWSQVNHIRPIVLPECVTSSENNLIVLTKPVFSPKRKNMLSIYCTCEKKSQNKRFRVKYNDVFAGFKAQQPLNIYSLCAFKTVQLPCRFPHYLTFWFC